MHIEPGQIVVITGASRGIGRETALEFADRKCRVALLARDQPLLDQLRNVIETRGGQAMVVPCDVSHEKDCFESIQKVVDQWGTIDILINNAGYGHYGAIENLDTQSLEQIFKTNLFGALWCTQAVIPVMKKQKSGHIVNVSTVISKRAFPYMGAYCMSKFAMTGFDESLRLELEPYGIRVALVCPGYTKTEFQQNAKVSGKKPNLREQKGMSPREVAQAIYQAVEHNKSRTILTRDGKLLLFMNKISPSFVDSFFRRYFKNL